MEDGLTRPNVYRNMKLPPTTVSTIKRNADEIDLSIQHVMKICATQVRHIFFFCKLCKTNGEIISIMGGRPK